MEFVDRSASLRSIGPVRCLVTGATGFIGRRLVESLLAAGHEVGCTARTSSRIEALRKLGVRLHTADVAAGEGVAAAVAGYDVVYHLAGVTRGRTYADFHQSNCLGVRHVVEACAAQTTPPVVVVVSSLAAAGPSGRRPHTPADESRPTSHYGRSKLAGESAARAYADRAPITIVRPPVVFGPGDPATLEWFRSIARFGLHVVPGFAPHRYSLIYVDELTAFLQAAAARGTRLPADDLRADVAAGLYYAARPETPTYAEIGRYAAAALGIGRYRTVRLPLALLQAYAWAGDAWCGLTGGAAIVGRDKVREAAAGSWCCIDARAGELFPFDAASLAERFQRTVDWYRAHAWL